MPSNPLRIPLISTCIGSSNLIHSGTWKMISPELRLCLKVALLFPISIGFANKSDAFTRAPFSYGVNVFKPFFYYLLVLVLLHSFYFLILSRCASQIIRKMIPITSKIQRIGPDMKLSSRPSSHTIKTIIAMTTSKLSILTSFCFLCPSQSQDWVELM
jgi:hypothetical protein